MSRVRELPLIPLHVRLVLASTKSDTSADEGAVLQLFDVAATFWLENAGIQMTLVSTLSQGPPDVFDSASLAEPVNWPDPLDLLYQAGSTWVTVVYVSEVGTNKTTRAGGVEVTPGLYPGKTHFAQPQLGRFGYGCVMIRREATWGSLAHELGHALGLPHVMGPGDAEAREEGTRDMFPFADDTTADDLGDDQVRNLMYNNVDDLSEDLAFLTDNQVRRARLTIATRRCPFSRFFLEDVAPYEGDLPLLDDICAPYLAQIFPA